MPRKNIGNEASSRALTQRSACFSHQHGRGRRHPHRRSAGADWCAIIKIALTAWTRFASKLNERMAVMDPHILDQLAERLSKALPPGMRELQQDAERNFRAVLQSTFAKLNLVTREEFDVQVALLARTHLRMQELERQVSELEARLKPQRSGDILP